MKCIAKIDAPLRDVCYYLSDEKRLPEYNDLVIENHDIDEILPHSKICWGSSPQILFIKPRDFITFCHLHWKKDGTQVVVNQAVEHEDHPPVEKEGQGKYARAYAIRGANCKLLYQTKNKNNWSKIAPDNSFISFITLRRKRFIFLILSIKKIFFHFPYRNNQFFPKILTILIKLFFR